MTRDQYVETRGDIKCSGLSVLHYYYYPEDLEGESGWYCDPSIETWHISKSMFEALLFESTRTNHLYNMIMDKQQ
jgi:hypothetical protein